MNKQIELKDCPFCGGEAHVDSEESEITPKWVGQVECKQCYFVCTHARSDNQNEAIDKAIKAWNTRTPAYQESAWLDISEVKACGYYLVWLQGVNEAETTAQWSVRKQFYYGEGQWDVEEEVSDRFTHFQHLPPPPKPKGKTV